MSNHTPWSEVPLTRGMFMKVDLEDFEWLSKFKWNANNKNGKFYAARSSDGTTVYAHRLLLKTDQRQVDHINGDSLDNRKANLRACSHGENQMNRINRKPTKSGIKGVKKHYGKWQARIRIDGQLKHLGTFDSKEGARNAYAEASKKEFGRFARPS